MNLIWILGIGLIVGGITGSGIFFAAGEPNKAGTFFAVLLRSILVSLLVGFSLGSGGPWWLGAGYGILYGLATILVLYLAETGFKKSTRAVTLFISSLLSGVIIGLLDAWLAFPRR
jgi:hypothetical protein